MDSAFPNANYKRQKFFVLVFFVFAICKRIYIDFLNIEAHLIDLLLFDATEPAVKLQTSPFRGNQLVLVSAYGNKYQDDCVTFA